MAEKYMSGPKADAILARTAPKKKKKRKAEAGPSMSGSGALIKDDDAGWGESMAKDDDDDDAADALIAADRGFKKRRVAAAEESNWTTIREPTPPPPEDEQPMVMDAQGAAQVPFTGGLLTAKQLREQMPSDKTTHMDEKHLREAREQAQETVYRDASGRKIDTKAEKAEAARKKREKEERDAKKMEWGKGLVQRQEEEERKRELERQRTKDVARYADDEDLNKDLKAQERWNDPAAAFLTKKRTKGPRKPEYTGPPPPPNRFGIKPGYRWDGVDRGNGFEKKLFQHQNDRKRRGQESYQWSVDDM